VELIKLWANKYFMLSHKHMGCSYEPRLIFYFCGEVDARQLLWIVHCDGYQAYQKIAFGPKYELSILFSLNTGFVWRWNREAFQ